MQCTNAMYKICIMYVYTKANKEKLWILNITRKVSERLLIAYIYI